MRSFAVFQIASLLIACEAMGQVPCGGCSDPCGQSGSGCANASAYGGSGCLSAGSVVSSSEGTYGSYVQAAMQSRQSLCEPITSYRVVLEPTYVMETQAVCSSETREEIRHRVRKQYRTVPVEEQNYRTKTVMVPKTETKTVNYTVLVPETTQKTVEITNSVPVWNDVTEEYTVTVPVLREVPETYTVRVPDVRDEETKYTVYVPQTETVTKMQTVSNAVPVVRTRTIQRCVPVSGSRTVTRDAGHWETRMEEVTVAAAPVVVQRPVQTTYLVSAGCGQGGMLIAGGCDSRSGCGQSYGGCGSSCGDRLSGGCSGAGCGAGGCGASSGSNYSSGSCGSTYAVTSTSYQQVVTHSAPRTQTVSRQVWVPNVVTEEVPVVESKSVSEEIRYTVFEQQSVQVPYECAYVVYRPEERTGTRKVVDYKLETRTRMRKVVEYTTEPRTRTRKELSYKEETKSETYPVVTMKSEQRTKEVTFTVNVPEVVVEPYTTTRYDQVAEDVVEEYTVPVTVPTMKEVQVQVCRMVPRLVPVTIDPCAQGQGTGANGCAGCGSTGGCAGCGSTSSPVAVPQSGCCGN